MKKANLSARAGAGELRVLVQPPWSIRCKSQRLHVLISGHVLAGTFASLFSVPLGHGATLDLHGLHDCRSGIDSSD